MKRNDNEKQCIHDITKVNLKRSKYPLKVYQLHAT